MTLPNFFIIGAPRCGTSSLYDGVRQHPDIFMSPIKEPSYFSISVRAMPFQGPKDAYYNHYLSRTEYEELFLGVASEQVVGEASTDYLFSESALNSLKDEFPNAKLVVILRNPAERAYSHYVQHISQDREPCTSFWEAIQQEEERKRQDWCHHWYYQTLGFYGRQLTRYFEKFDNGQIKVFLTDDLHSDATQVYRELFKFLNVDESFQPKAIDKKHNASMIPSNNYLQGFITKPSISLSILRRILPKALRSMGRIRVLSGRKMSKPPGINPVDKKRLIDGYKEDIELLGSLIGRNLSTWLECLEISNKDD